MNQNMRVSNGVLEQILFDTVCISIQFILMELFMDESYLILVVRITSSIYVKFLIEYLKVSLVVIVVDGRLSHEGMINNFHEWKEKLPYP